MRQARVLTVLVALLALSPAATRPEQAQLARSAPASQAIFRPSPAAAREHVDIVVAQDGSGDFRTVQAALDALAKDSAAAGSALQGGTPDSGAVGSALQGGTSAVPATKTILVKNGTYAEKIFITTSHVAIVGEDREKTRIVYAELRRNWRATHDNDWGAAVVNIGDDVTDVVMANLTVRNNYGSLHGDHDHQFALRSGGRSNRVVLLHANIVADGGDTLSLWNADSGMWYHADCYFEGWVDYACPRGWCYITDSRFFGHNMTASIWHDGSKDPDQKFVIRHSTFDGEAGFPLGRNNRDGQFYLLDCEFSSNMADRPIYQASASETYQFPPRYYFFNCHRRGGDFAWFADNLASAKGAPRAADITARWTFAGRWDPEATITPVLTFAAVPRPRMADTEVTASGVTLRWLPGRLAASHRVYFGTSNPPPVAGDRTQPTYDTGPLRAATTYYWRVDEVTPAGIVAGRVWEFTTEGAKGSRESQSASVVWSDCLRQPAEWYGSSEAVRVGDNVLLYQRRSAGWPKNIDMAEPLNASQRAAVLDAKDENDSTIDNQATYTQIRYLARVYAASRLERFRTALLAGLDYLLAAQYPNGGWPQFYPLRTNYSRHITFNDDAMVGALKVMRDAAEGKPPFDVVDAGRRRRCADAVRRGTELILKAQVRVNGRLTAWCAQHDEKTLAPAAARSYEHVSLSGRESVGVVEFLVDIDQPDARIVAAVEAAVAWFRSVRVTGLRIVRRPSLQDGGRDDVGVEPDPAAPPLWARFYEIGSNRPIFSGRDGVVKYHLAEIEYERRSNYAWYGTWPADLLEKQYPGWKSKRQATSISGESTR